MTSFICDKCHEQKTNDSQHTTGYGTNDKGEKHCYECCAKEDAAYLLEHGKLQGYFVEENKQGYFTNWPGSLKIPIYARRVSWHNFAGRNGRTDFWLKYNGQNYHGVQIGHNSQIATIRRTKN